MAGRSPARFLAPIALLAFAFALYSIVHTEREPAGNDSSSPAASSTATSTKTASTHHHTHHTHHIYVVKSGDTLSGIAEKTHVSTDKLQKLNPHIQPQSLSPGQRLKLTG